MMRRAARAILLTLALALVACDRPAPRAAATPAHRAEFGESPLKVVVELDRAEITTAQRAALRIERAVDEGWSLVPWAPPESWGGLTIERDRRAPPATPGAAAIDVLTLAPYLPGEEAIPAISFAATRGGDRVVVSTTPLALTVTSLLEGAAEADPALIKPVAEPPAESALALWLAGAAAALAAVFLLPRALRRSGDTSPLPPPPPAVIALERLAVLLAGDALPARRFKVFYFELSQLLRDYIEARFGLHAPDRTTEEFLREAAGSARLDSDDVALLRRFLRSCDLVKFAEHTPTDHGARDAAELARSFIERTREDVAPRAGARTESAPAMMSGAT